MKEESEYCSDVMKKLFNKKLVMTKKDEENFKNCTKYWICDNDYVDNVVKVRDDFHVLENMEILHIELLISILN